MTLPRGACWNPTVDPPSVLSSRPGAPVQFFKNPLCVSKRPGPGLCRPCYLSSTLLCFVCRTQADHKSPCGSGGWSRCSLTDLRRAARHRNQREIHEARDPTASALSQSVILASHPLPPLSARQSSFSSVPSVFHRYPHRRASLDVVAASS